MFFEQIYLQFDIDYQIIFNNEIQIYDFIINLKIN